MSELKALKDEWLEAVERHTGMRQPEFRKKLTKIKTLKALHAEAVKSKKYWAGEGEKWDHDFYYQFAGIVSRIEKKIAPLLNPNLTDEVKDD